MKRLIIHNRLIKAAFWIDPDLLQWNRDKRWFYEGLCQLADDSGCLENSPFAFKIHLFPSPVDSDITVEAIEQWVQELIVQKKLITYTAKGKECLYLANFHKHQSLRSPAPPDVPLPQWIRFIPSEKGKNNEYLVGEINENGTDIVTDDRDLVSNSYETHKEALADSYDRQIEVEEEREVEREKEVEEEVSAAPESDQAILAELKKIKGWPYDIEKDLALITSFKNDFLGIDILEEAKAMSVWLIDRPLKKNSNPRSFFRNWCKKAKKGVSRHEGYPPKPNPTSRGKPEENRTSYGDLIDL